MNKRIIKTVMCILPIVGIATLNIKNSIHAIYAHSAQLDVDYDTCVPEDYSNSNDIGDGEDEKWYEFVKNGMTYHIVNSAEVTEIKYYLSETSPDGNTSWADFTTNQSLNDYIKNTFLESVMKWGNIYFYKHNINNQIIKHKLVNFVEGTSTNYNLIIFPDNNFSGAASCSPTSTQIQINDGGVANHVHYEKWRIRIDVDNYSDYSNYLDYFLNRTGAHEFGHVLGLRDIDGCENSSSSNYHHEELLMGYSRYGLSYYARQSEITYKDLVGAAITRGYHTDNDHKWMYDTDSSNVGNHKLICSICNGVKYVDSLSGYSYELFKSCNDNHALSSGNMFAVASYNNYDYYKCKYCRYVAPFIDNVIQNYTYTYVNEGYHSVANQVSGLNYTFSEQHTLDSTNTCTGCGQHIHYYTDHYVPKNAAFHKAYCSCGNFVLASHVVLLSGTYTLNGHVYGNCICCGTLVDLTTTNVIVQGFDGLMVSANGSYIAPSGIYVLVDEDLESYLNGTLSFHLYGEVNE